MRQPIVDSHVHVMPDAAPGSEAERDPYEIWEYGTKDDVEILPLAGTIGQVSDALRAAEADHFVAVNLFVPWSELDKMTGPDGSVPSLESRLGELRDRLVAFNTWSLDLAADRSDMTVFVAVDPHVMGGKDGAEHLRWAHERGALGFKIHPVSQRFLPDDPRMDDLYATAEELGIGVVSHAGASHPGAEWAAPRAFASVLDAHPDLKLVLAHLGGGRWQQTVALAEAYPQLRFDLCEIIAWVGAPGAPSLDELGRMIKAIGAERVLFGTDFPWYRIDRTIDQLMGLPHLSDEERQLVLGVNAVELWNLPVSG